MWVGPRSNGVSVSTVGGGGQHTRLGEQHDGLDMDGEEFGIMRPARQSKRSSSPGWLVSGLGICVLLLLIIVVTLIAIVSESGDDASDDTTAPPETFTDNSVSRCSDHGIYDGVSATCLCFACYQGEKCDGKMELSDCKIDATGGNPQLFEEYWVQHPGASIEVLPSDHVGYGEKLGCDKLARDGEVYALSAEDVLDTRCDLLAEAIRRLHREVGNADAANWYIVPGVGSTELVAAALFTHRSFIATDQEKDVDVYVRRPYHDGYKKSALWLEKVAKVHWLPSAKVPHYKGTTQMIELITSPNNPDGAHRQAHFHKSHAVYDYAFQWPVYTGAKAAQLEEIHNGSVAVFSLSEVTGHASTRIGWALTKSKENAMHLMAYLAIHGGLPRESQLRALRLLDHLHATSYKLLGEARKEMQRRWTVLEEVFGGSPCFQTQDRGAPRPDAWSGETAVPTPAFAWIACTNTTAALPCTKTFSDIGVSVREGEDFGALEGTRVRMALLMRTEAFSFLVDKIRTLLETEGGGC